MLQASLGSCRHIFGSVSSRGTTRVWTSKPVAAKTAPRSMALLRELQISYVGTSFFAPRPPPPSLLPAKRKAPPHDPTLHYSCPHHSCPRQCVAGILLPFYSPSQSHGASTASSSCRSSSSPPCSRAQRDRSASTPPSYIRCLLWPWPR